MKYKYVNYLENDVNYIPSGKSPKPPKKKTGKKIKLKQKLRNYVVKMTVKT